MLATFSSRVDMGSTEDQLRRLTTSCRWILLLRPSRAPLFSETRTLRFVINARLRGMRRSSGAAGIPSQDDAMAQRHDRPGRGQAGQGDLGSPAKVGCFLFSSGLSLQSRCGRVCNQPVHGRVSLIMGCGPGNRARRRRHVLVAGGEPGRDSGGPISGTGMPGSGEPVAGSVGRRLRRPGWPGPGRSEREILHRSRNFPSGSRRIARSPVPGRVR